jgi:hypothetical protein
MGLRIDVAEDVLAWLHDTDATAAGDARMP